MKEIPINEDFKAIVDDEDYLTLSKFKWRAFILRHTTYIVRGEWSKSERRSITIYMHRQILGLLPEQFVDHINGIGWDNRRSNLRICTRSENQRNMKLYSDSRTKFKGVDFHKKAKKFRARIVIEGKQKHLGLFDTPEAAHAVYCTAAIENFGQFARFN